MLKKRSMLGVGLALWGLAAFGCQKGAPPRAIMLEVPEQVIGADAARVSVTLTDQNGAISSSKAKHDFVVEPAELARVSKEGFVTCQKSGDAKLSLTIQGVTGSTDLACRMVDK